MIIGSGLDHRRLRKSIPERRLCKFIELSWPKDIDRVVAELEKILVPRPVPTVSFDGPRRPPMILTLSRPGGAPRQPPWCCLLRRRSGCNWRWTANWAGSLHVVGSAAEARDFGFLFHKGANAQEGGALAGLRRPSSSNHDHGAQQKGPRRRSSTIPIASTATRS